MNESVSYDGNSRKKKNNGLVITLIIMIILLLVFGGYVVYDKFLSNGENNNSNNQVTILDINSSTVKDLIYPKINFEGYNFLSWVYKNISVYDGREWMMLSASNGIGTKKEDGKFSISSSDMMKNFVKMFGPDIYYSDAPLSLSCLKFIFDSKTFNTEYEATCKNGAAGFYDWSYEDWSNEVKLYKAEQKNDEIHTYFYVQPYIKGPNIIDKGYLERDNETWYLFKRQIAFPMFMDMDSENGNSSISESGKVYYIKKLSKTTAKNDIQNMMNSGEVDTYRFTFKKQSDGNYYFYSGNWE